MKESDNYKYPKPFPEGEQGDFYVENGACTACGAPQAEAPDLIDHSKEEWGHCYFKKQPRTDEEIERAITAIAVSCVSGLRYRGKDEKILKRLYEVGEAAQCDHTPVGNYKLVVWNKVKFQFTGTTSALSDILTNQYLLGPSHINNQIIDFETNRKDWFQFIHRWTEGLSGNIFTCCVTAANTYEIKVGKEPYGLDASIRYNAIKLNSILCNDNRISNIEWFDSNGNRYDVTQIR